MINKRSFLSILLSSLLACSSETTYDLHLHSDDVVKADEWEALVAARIQGSPNQRGGGSGVLIGDLHVVTAAHVLVDELGVSTGFDRVYSHGQPQGDRYRFIQSIAIHPRYFIDAPKEKALDELLKSTTASTEAKAFFLQKIKVFELSQNHYDVAVITLAEPFSKSNPIQLIPVGTPLAISKPLTYLGYGRSGRGATDWLLRRGQSKKPWKLRPIANGRFAYIETSGDTGYICSGDSGGPLLYERNGVSYILGIHTRSSAQQHCQPAAQQKSYHHSLYHTRSWVRCHLDAEIAGVNSCSQGEIVSRRQEVDRWKSHYRHEFATMN